MKTKLRTLEAALRALEQLTGEDSPLGIQDRAKINEVKNNVVDALLEERAKEFILNVYPVRNGCSTESVFEGTAAQCTAYLSRRREEEPEFDCVIL